MARSMASLTVWIEDGQPSQLPSRRRCTTPWGSIPSSSTPPACEPRYGRTLSRASTTRVSVSLGWRPWRTSRLATSSSSTSRSVTSGPASSTVRSSPAPYSSTTRRTISSAVSAVPGSPAARSRPSSSSIRVPTSRRSRACPVNALPLVEHGRRVQLLHHVAVAQVHVDPAGQARVEAADRPHDVDALELLRRVLLEDGGVLDGVLVGAGGAVDVAHAAVPRRRRGGGGGGRPPV